MEISPSNNVTDGIGESQCDTNHTNNPSEVLDDVIGSPLTPTANLSFSTPHEPSRRKSLIKCFESLQTSEEAEDEDCYDSDGNEPPCIKDTDFNHFEASIDTILSREISTIPSTSKFVFISDEDIDGLKVDELRQELVKRSLSKSGLKAELRERLKKAMVDRIAIADAEKSSAGPEGFDQGSKWVLLEPDMAAVEPTCVDPSLLDPSSFKYGDGKTNTSSNKVLKMDYSSKFVRDEFIGEALQPKKSLLLTTKLEEIKSKKRKTTKPFNSRLIEYIKKPTNGKLLPNIKFTRKNRLDENSHPAEWLRALIPDTPPKGSNQSFSKKQWCQYTNMKAELDCAGEKNQDGLGYKFENFTPQEIEQHLSLYIFQGLNPSPQLIMKTRSQIFGAVAGE